MPFVILIGAIVSALLWFLGMRRFASTGLPSRDILSADVGAEFPLARSLVSERYGVTGKPDYVIRVEGGIVPVELKRALSPRDGRPHEGHRYQVAAYCLLLEEAFETRVPYGLIRYGDRTLTVEFDAAARAGLLRILDEMRAAAESGVEQHISHRHAGKCRSCTYRESCGESLV